MSEGSSSAMIERAGPNDLMQLALDIGPLPMQIAALVLFEPGSEFDLMTAMATVGRRAGRVPRLRQRLVRPPFGCGRAYWLDDADFDPGRHTEVILCAAPGDEPALLVTAQALAARPLPRSRPMWSAAFVTGLADGRVALVLVMHHVIADGLGGLAVLGDLVDQGSQPRTAPAANRFPRPAPSWRTLFLDAWTTRLRALPRLPGRLRQLIPAATELGGVRPATAPRTSLNRPTGARRQTSVASADLAAVSRAAHARGGTVNDVLLAAVAGALGGLLRSRGETVQRLVVSVPVSSRPAGTGHEAGNHVGVMALAVPVAADPLTRLKAIVMITRARKRPRPGASATLLEPAFRVLGATGLLGFFINHQRLVNTFVTNVAGPVSPVTFMNAPVSSIIPISGAAGNTAVAFAALSYAGVLTVTVIADPEAVPDLQKLTADLQHELDAFSSPT